MPAVAIAEHAGACYGVERALSLVREAADSDKGVFTLGPLIHNPRVIADLERHGARPVSTVDEAAGATLVLRSHGVTPDEERRAREICTRVVDATCPFVKRVHKAVERLSADGYEVVVVGERHHPEVVATLAHAAGSRAVPTADEARTMDFGPRVGIVVQTTQSEAVLESVVSVIDDGSREVKLINTICEATAQRQRAAADLAASVDAMLVVGGRNSANTTHLAEICSAICPRTYHIEDASEIDLSWLEGASAIGITAGASTPSEHISAVREALEALG